MKLKTTSALQVVLLCVFCATVFVASAQTRQVRRDTLRIKPTKDVEVSMEVPAQKGNTLYIINSSKNLDIKTWGESKVKIVSTVTIDEDATAGSNTEMFEKAGITLRSTSNRVELNARGTATPTLYGTSVEGLIYHNDFQQITLVPGKEGTTSTVVGYKTKRKTITVFVPQDVKLDIDTRSSDVIIRDDYKQARFNLASTNLDAQNIDDLSMLARFSVVNVGDLDDAQIEFENGTFRANKIENLDIDSKSSTIEYEDGENIYLRSQRDNYSIESIKKIEGRKQFGELRIDKLSTLLDIEGNNADVKVRNILPTVERIKLSNSYADVRLPLRHLENYSVAFQGNYSTVFAPFEKNVIKEERPAGENKLGKTTQKVNAENKKAEANTDEVVVVEGHKLSASTINGYGNLDTGSRSLLNNAIGSTFTLKGEYFSQTNGEISPSKFTASVGDEKGKKTKFDLTCNSCTIDFK